MSLAVMWQVERNTENSWYRWPQPHVFYQQDLWISEGQCKLKRCQSSTRNLGKEVVSDQCSDDPGLWKSLAGPCEMWRLEKEFWRELLMSWVTPMSGDGG